jgi:hypothetical protein
MKEGPEESGRTPRSAVASQSSEKLKGAMKTLGAHAHARKQERRNHAHAHDARLLSQKVTHLLNDAFMRVVDLPPTYGSAPKPI